MKAQELRLGNYIFIDEEEIVVTGINGNTIHWKDGFDMTGMTGSKLTGIPLTEDWLLKFGFKKGEYEWFEKLYDSQEEVGLISYNIDSHRTAIGYVDGEDSGFAGYEIKYVHQLQNLYFALTGNELTIKLKTTTIS
jgi:hypothetical protein